jgi:hypothetical protein
MTKSAPTSLSSKPLDLTVSECLLSEGVRLAFHGRRGRREVAAPVRLLRTARGWRPKLSWSAIYPSFKWGDTPKQTSGYFSEWQKGKRKAEMISETGPFAE